MAKASDAPSTEEVVQAVEATATAQAPFYQYEYLDGDEKVFATKDDLDKAFRASYLRRQDYERNLSEVEKVKKTAEEQLAEMKAERDRDRAIVSEYLEWDRKLRSEPGLYDRVASAMRGGGGNNFGQANAGGGMSEEMASRIEKLEKALEESQKTSQAEKAFQSVASRYQDFNDHADTVDELLARMESGDDEAIYEIAYHAARGYGSPGQEAAVQAKVRESRAAAPLASSNGAQPAVESSVKPGTSVEEARNIAYQELGIVPE